MQRTSPLPAAMSVVRLTNSIQPCLPPAVPSSATGWTRGSPGMPPDAAAPFHTFLHMNDIWHSGRPAGPNIFLQNNFRSL
jgi:hypothetical protein